MIFVNHSLDFYFKIVNKRKYLMNDGKWVVIYINWEKHVVKFELMSYLCNLNCVLFFHYHYFYSKI